MSAEEVVEPAPRPTVLVVGGSGYVGQFVIQALLARGLWEVHTLHRPGREPDELPSDVRRHGVELTDAEGLARVLREVDPIAVVNCAAMSGLGACEKDPAAAAVINCPQGLVEAVAAQARVSPRLFIHFSTDIVFGGDPMQVYDEHSAPTPVNVYGHLKAKFDAFLTGLTEPTCVVLRPTNIVGPVHPYVSRGTKFLQWLDGRLRVDEPTQLFEDEFRNYVWVEDLVEVVIRLVEDFPAAPPPHRLMHCGGPEALSRVDVARALAAAKGYASTYEGENGEELLRVVPTPRAAVDLGYPSPLCIRFRSDRAERYLGRAMRSIAACVREHACRI